MRLFFCKKCGKRLDDRDLESGTARDKKLKGVFCTECSVGVHTMEMQTITMEDLRRISSEEHPPQASQTKRPKTDALRSCTKDFRAKRSNCC